MTAHIAVEGGNSVTPPELTGDTPVEDVIHPVKVILRESFGNEADRAALYSLDSRLCKWLHFYEPLIRGKRFDSGAAAVAGADVVIVRNGLYEEAICLKIGNECLTAGVSVHTLVLARVGVHSSIVVHNLDLLKAVALTYEEVVGVVSGGNLYAARTEAYLNVIVCNYGNLAVYYGKYKSLADKMLGCLVLGVYCNGGITEHSLGSGGSYLNVAVLALDRILDMPEVTGLILILYLGIRERGKATGAPVDYSVSAINKTLIIEVYEYLTDCAGAALVHSEALAAPVTGRAELL